MFRDLCGFKALDRHQLVFARRLVKRAHRYGGAVFIFMPMRIWRAFHKRHRLLMLSSSRPKFRALAAQLDASKMRLRLKEQFMPFCTSTASQPRSRDDLYPTRDREINALAYLLERFHAHGTPEDFATAPGPP